MTTPNPSPNFLLYQSEDGHPRIQCRLHNNTLWLTQAQIAELFQTTPQNVTQHLKLIYAEGEISEEATCKPYLQVRREGEREVSRKLRHYRLEAVLAVGFRVRSHRGTQFRQWAIEQLRGYLVKGFAIDDDRLKNPTAPDQSAYFEELLCRIRDIRSSEKVFWRKVLDIYATSIDYDPSFEASQRFFQTVQNKMHWAGAWSHGRGVDRCAGQRGRAEHGPAQLARRQPAHGRYHRRPPQGRVQQPPKTVPALNRRRGWNGYPAGSWSVSPGWGSSRAKRPIAAQPPGPKIDEDDRGRPSSACAPQRDRAALARGVGKTTSS